MGLKAVASSGQSLTPSFTSVTTPLVIGGTAAGSTLTLQSTTGTGTTDKVLVKVGTNGGTTAGTFDHNGFNGIIGGTTAAAGSFTTLGATGLLALSSMVITRATTDQSITSNVTLASATNMSFPIAASEEWVADFDLDIGANLNSTGVQFAVAVPSGATLNVCVGIVSDVVDIVTGVYSRRTTTSGSALNFTTSNMVATSNAQVRISVWVLNSTNAGTVQLQIAQSTSSGTALLLRKGSHMRANRVA